FGELLPDGETMVIRSAVGWVPGGIMRARPDSQTGCALISKTPVMVEDYRTETRFAGFTRGAGGQCGTALGIGWRPFVKTAQVHSGGRRLRSGNRQYRGRGGGAAVPGS